MIKMSNHEAKMDGSTRFKISHGQIIQETFDDEVVVVNLGAGTYYSLAGAGTKIWNAALSGASIQQIVAQLAARYQAEIDEVQRETVAFLEKLQAEELLSQESASNASSPEIEYSKKCARGNGTRCFCAATTAKVHRYAGFADARSDS